jgi:hypothetical protein
MNYKHLPGTSSSAWSYDPHNFSLSAARDRVKAAIQVGVKKKKEIFHLTTKVFPGVGALVVRGEKGQEDSEISRNVLRAIAGWTPEEFLKGLNGEYRDEEGEWTKEEEEEEEDEVGGASLRDLQMLRRVGNNGKGLQCGFCGDGGAGKRCGRCLSVRYCNHR